jgi:hypothetical protein
MLSYKYGLGGQDGRARQRFENALNFARNALERGDAKTVFADDLTQWALNGRKIPLPRFG